MALSIWQKLQSLLQPKDAASGATAEEAEILNPCCDQPEVHVAYRGKSDDRLYLAKDRTWQEVRFFSPNGLRVFCKKCRRRVY